jgi:hypothetical protein
MRRIVRARLRLAAALAVTAMASALITTIWPTWIEGLFGAAPDAGSGEAEWWLVAVLLAIAIAAGLFARRELLVIRQREGPSESR